VILFWTLCGATWLGTLVLAWCARRVGWGDAATGPAAERKLQRLPVPPVGGLAILVSYAVFVGGDPEVWASGWMPLLGAVFVVGLLDDAIAGGLEPWTKLLLLGLGISAPLLLTGGAADPVGLALAVAVGLAATNVTNTFDNADGAVAAVAVVGFAFVEPVLVAVPLGFLVLNLDSAAPWRRGSAVPTAYLGDSGAYVLGLLLVAHGAWPAFWIPLLDLLRLSVVRWRAGSRPWIGDRRHLAHRLQARGLPPSLVAANLAAMTVPGCLGVFLADGSALLPALGLALGALIYVFAVRRTPASQ